MSIGENYLEIVERKNRAAVRSGRNPGDVLLLAVTKLHTVEEINQAISAGATDAGENRVQELLEKYDRTAEPVRWHLIGHLQTNKVKNIIDKVVLIHSVDSLKLAKEISKRAIAADKVMDILIEINIGMEESKSGVPAEDVESLIKEIAAECEGVRIRGVMCVPPIGETPEDSRPYFKKTKAIFDNLKTLDLPQERFLPDTLSMGMSGDFEVAVEEGATIVRVGSSIFGKRNYR
nr:YggS family pyridoxal phosphate-dependent enzyme [uncultured Mogibacterium sp.]